MPTMSCRTEYMENNNDGDAATANYGDGADDDEGADNDDGSDDDDGADENQPEE